MKTLWVHRQSPTPTLLNEYSAALNAAHDGLGNFAEWSVAQRRTSESVYTLQHVYRYLHFTSNGKIMELNDSNEQDINEDETGRGVLDLESLDWLIYGQLYKVTGVSVCLEDWSA